MKRHLKTANWPSRTWKWPRVSASRGATLNTRIHKRRRKFPPRSWTRRDISIFMNSRVRPARAGLNWWKDSLWSRSVNLSQPYHHHFLLLHGASNQDRQPRATRHVTSGSKVCLLWRRSRPRTCKYAKPSPRPDTKYYFNLEFVDFMTSLWPTCQKCSQCFSSRAARNHTKPDLVHTSLSLCYVSGSSEVSRHSTIYYYLYVIQKGLVYVMSKVRLIWTWPSFLCRNDFREWLGWRIWVSLGAGGW